MSKRAVPVIRFADFSDVWKQHKFSEIFNILQNCTLSRAELSYEIGDVLNIHYGDVLIKYGEVINADTAVLPRIADPKIEAKYRSSELQDGDIIIADTAEDETIGKCAEMRNLHGKVAISGLHTIPSRPVEIFAAGYLPYPVSTAMLELANIIFSMSRGPESNKTYIQLLSTRWASDYEDIYDDLKEQGLQDLIKQPPI